MKKIISIYLSIAFILIQICCIPPYAKADITDPIASGTYYPNNDGSLTLNISVTYVTFTIEWLDCVQFTLPEGWTYVPDGESGDAVGFNQGSMDNVVTFGNDPGCPGFSSVMYGSWGGTPYLFSFTMMPLADFDIGYPDVAGDGDTIPFTWTYLGDWGSQPDTSPVDPHPDTFPTQSPLIDEPIPDDTTSTSIPTLSEWGLLILALILLNFGVLYLRNDDESLVNQQVVT